MIQSFNHKLAINLLCLAIAVVDVGVLNAGVVIQADTVRYTIITGADSSGFMWVVGHPRGRTFHTYYAFNDRGRGNALNTEITLDSEGLPVSLRTEGNDYYKVPYLEEYVREGGTAQWTSPGEQDRQSVSSPVFYVSFDPPVIETAVLARALMSAPRQELALLPYGRARLERIRDLNVDVTGSSQTVTLFAIHGLTGEPTYVWLDEQGRYFGTSWGWFGAVRQGWEPLLPQLKRAQDDATLERLRRLATQLPRRPDRPVAFRNATLFDSETGSTREHMTVVVDGDRISAVGQDGNTPVSDDAEIVDASGKTLMPGLFDMHVHAQPDQGLLQLAAGVTTVRDLANDIDFVVAAKNQIDRGELIGPRMVLAGFIDGAGPYAGPTGAIVSSKEEAIAAIDRYADLGFSQIKLYSSLDTSWVPVMINAAHARGLRVSGHIPAHMNAAAAVRFGLDEIQHANFLVLNFLSDTLDTRTPARFHEPAALGASLDLGSGRVMEFVNLLREHDVIVDPTLSIFERMYTSRPGEPSPGFAAVRHRFPLTQRRLVESGSGGLQAPEGMSEVYRASYRKMLAFVRLLHDNRVRIVAGTDAFPVGFALHRELELYEEAGIPAGEVLRIATWTAAGVAGLRDELGSIAQGKLADLILIDGMPASRISDIRNVDLVMKGGIVYDPDELHSAAGYRPRDSGR